MWYFPFRTFGATGVIGDYINDMTSRHSARFASSRWMAGFRGGHSPARMGCIPFD